jgi:hypothetical protein
MRAPVAESPYDSRCMQEHFDRSRMGSEEYKSLGEALHRWILGLKTVEQVIDDALKIENHNECYLYGRFRFLPRQQVSVLCHS